jgi:tRNA:m4X modification enzyme
MIADEKAGEVEARAGGCVIYLAKKHRYCAWPVRQGSLCGHHAEQRVPCPLDATHSINACDVAAHVQRCTAGRVAAAAAEQPFLRSGLNEGVQLESAGEACRAEAARLWRLHPDDAEFPAARERVLSVVALLVAAAELLPPLPRPLPLPPLVEEALERARAAAAGAHAVDPWDEKHGVQQAGLLAAVHAEGLLPPPGGATCAELGAGRGYLSALLAACCDDTAPPPQLLVDRRAYRNKAERALRRGGAPVRRLRADLADLDLGAAAGDAPVLVVAKHLCGSAADLGLRAAVRLGPRLAGLAMACCCHHGVTWERYVAQDWCAAARVGQPEFAIAARIASWCVDAHGAPAQAAAQAAGCSRWGLSAPERAAAGAAAKQWLDQGRAQWLAAQLGAPARVATFVPASVSPENRVLLYGGISK